MTNEEIMAIATEIGCQVDSIVNDGDFVTIKYSAPKAITVGMHEGVADAAHVEHALNVIKQEQQPR